MTKLWRRHFLDLTAAGPRLALTAIALTAGACSAEIGGAGGVDQPSFGLTDGASSAGRPPDARRSALSGADSGNLSRGAEPLRIAALPPAAAPSRPAPVKSGTVEVQKGDTLSGLAKRHGVSVADLMTANGLTSHILKLGQKLALPGAPRRAASADLAPRPAGAPQAPSPPPPPPGWDGSYTMRPGDSLYGVARRHGVKLAELERVNGIADARRVRPGKTLRVPARAAGDETASAAPAAPRPSTPSRASAERPAGRGEPESPPVAANETAAPANVPGEVAALAPAPSAPPPSAAEDEAAKLRWPGKIVAPFGEREDGTRNDGVNIAVPMGTDVHAAEGGIVAYAGGELAGYGQLVLVRHDNGWVTAYAHNHEILVARGDKVRRGQVIARAGNSGLSGQPQLHFELRQGAKPVNPAPFMETM